MASSASRSHLSSEIRNLQTALRHEQTNKRQLSDEVETLQSALKIERERVQTLGSDCVDHEDASRLEIRALQTALEHEEIVTRKLITEVETLRTALEAEQKRNQDLTAANDDLLTQKGTEIAIRDEDLDVEEGELRQRNAMLTYDINCLKTKNGRLEKNIEQLHESAILLPTHESLVGLDLRVPSDNELVSELLTLDSSIRSWCEEWISKFSIAQCLSNPQILPFTETLVRYTLVDGNEASAPFATAIIWMFLTSWIFDTTDSRVIEEFESRENTARDLWTTPGNARSLRKLENTFYNSEKLKSNFEAVNQWRRLTASLLAKETQSEHYNIDKDAELIKKTTLQKVINFSQDTFGVIDRNLELYERLNSILSHIIQQAITYSLKLRLHPKLLRPRLQETLEVNFSDSPTSRSPTVKGEPLRRLIRRAELRLITCPGLYEGIGMVDGPRGLGISWGAIEEPHFTTIPIWIHPEKRKGRVK